MDMPRCFESRLGWIGTRGAGEGSGLGAVDEAAAVIAALWAATPGKASESQGIFSEGETGAECKLETFRYKLNGKGN